MSALHPVCCLFLDVDFKRSGTKPNQVLFKILLFFAETESAWMQNRIVGRIHMAALSHRSRSDDAAKPKFQIPKTDQNYGVKQSHNWYLKEHDILYNIDNSYGLL